jgi:succinate-acetate transporter protein
MTQGNQFVSETVTKIKDTTSNPAPLGLLGFGMTTVLLNIHNAGFYGFNTMILGMGLAYGGIAQVIAGIQEWKKGNTFGATAFTSYGLFWLSLVALFMMTGYDKPDKTATACYFFMWGLFTLVMFIGTLKLNKALMVVFGSLTILFFMLCIRDATFAKAADFSTTFGKITGYEGIICGLSAIYAALAQVLNEVYGKVVLSIGPVVAKTPKK